MQLILCIWIQSSIFCFARLGIRDELERKFDLFKMQLTCWTDIFSAENHDYATVKLYKEILNWHVLEKNWMNSGGRSEICA